MTITADQRASWLAAAETAVGPARPDFESALKEFKPSTVEVCSTEFFAVMRMARHGDLVVSGMRVSSASRARYELTLGWPAPRQVELAV